VFDDEAVLDGGRDRVPDFSAELDLADPPRLPVSRVNAQHPANASRRGARADHLCSRSSADSKSDSISALAWRSDLALSRSQRPTLSSSRCYLHPAACDLRRVAWQKLLSRL